MSKFLNYEVAEALSSKMKITDQSTGSFVYWKMNTEQKIILKALCEERRVIVVKARQLGATLVHAYYIALQAIARPYNSIGVVNYKFEESKKLLKKIKNFLSQLGIKFKREAAFELELTNGSTIQAITAVSPASGEPGSGQESKAGRGNTYSILYCSEAAYYKGSESVFASLTAGLTSNSQVFLESTASPGSNMFKNIWDSENTEYKKIFLSFELHEEYRLNNLLSPEEFAPLQERLGFTNIEAANWWVNKLRTDLGNDETRMLREYPILSYHPWLAASGRWVSLEPRILPYLCHSKYNKLHIYYQPVEELKQRYVASIDTASGGGGDDSCIVVWDCKEEKIVASYTDNTTPIDVLMTIYKELHNMYKPEYLYIEKNGIGHATVMLARSHNYPVVEYTATNASRYTGFVWARNKIMNGLAADEALRENCLSTQVHSSSSGTDRFSGRKDFLAALSFIGIHEAQWKELANKPIPIVYGPNQFNAQKFIQQAINQNKKPGWMR